MIELRTFAEAERWLRDLLGRMFSPISRREAVRIASRKLANDAGNLRLICDGTKPPNFRIFTTWSEPCWYIHAPWNDGMDGAMLRGSRVILVGKLTGTIYYDGSAGDEG